jgi:hypothetical protein
MLVIGEVLVFTWFMPNLIADAPIQPEKTSSLGGLSARLKLFIRHFFGTAPTVL